MPLRRRKPLKHLMKGKHMKTKCRYTVMSICVAISLVSGALKVVGVIELEWLAVSAPILAGLAFKLASLLLTLTVILFRWRLRK